MEKRAVPENNSKVPLMHVIIVFTWFMYDSYMANFICAFKHIKIKCISV